MKRKCASLFVVLVIVSGGCAKKKAETTPPSMKREKLSLKPRYAVTFKGIKDGKCEIADVFVNAKDKSYTVICK